MGCILFGYVMEFIYNVTYSVFGIENIGLAIIVFTMLVNIAMIPLLMKQQKSMKINNIIQPEIRRFRKNIRARMTRDRRSACRRRRRLSMTNTELL